MVAALMLEQALKAQHERLLRLSAAWDAYHGTFPKPLKVISGQPDDNLILSYAKLIVDKGSSFLFGEDTTFEVDADTSEEDEDSGETEPDDISTPDAWLRKCWEVNRRMTTLLSIAQNGGVCGDVFVRIRDTKPFPKLQVLDPANVDVIVDPDDYTVVQEYRIEWNTVDPNTGKPVTKRTSIEPTNDANGDPVSWTILDQESVGDSQSFVTLKTTPWPRPWAPILHCQNLPLANSYWGIADLEDDILATNRAMNFAVTSIGRILRFHAHPQMWASGLQVKDLDVAIGKIITMPNPEARMGTVEMQSDLGSSLEFFKKVKGTLHEVSRVPEIATGAVEGLGPISGVALQVLYQPLLEKTGTKRLLYGEMLVEICLNLLELGNFGRNHQVRIQWPQMLPVDSLAEAQTAVLYDQLGVSKDTIQTKLGFDAKAEAEKRGKEDAAAMKTGAAMLENFDRGRNQPPDGEPPAAS